jgi:hypothetical protein
VTLANLSTWYFRRSVRLRPGTICAGWLHPQYKVAARLLLQALTEENLDWLALMDPKAARLDDFQLATAGRLRCLPNQLV